MKDLNVFERLIVDILNAIEDAIIILRNKITGADALDIHLQDEDVVVIFGADAVQLPLPGFEEYLNGKHTD